VYGRKCDVFLDALKRYLGPLESAIHWTHPQGGLFVWMTVPADLNTGFEGPLFPRCLQEGIIYVPGEYAFAPEPTPVPKNHLRLTFGVPSEVELVEGARRLAAALCTCVNPFG
jgi:2-aminoadipate transaminase